MKPCIWICYGEHQVNAHIGGAVSSGRKLLGVMKRWGKGLSVSALITVYASIVRPKLEYVSVTWNSIGKDNYNKIEAVQRNFVKYLAHIENINYDNTSYKDSCIHFNLPLLSDRRTYFDLLFLFKSVNGIFDCQPFFNLHVPGRTTRQCRTFQQPGGRVKFSQQSLFNRIPSLVKGSFSDLCIFSSSVDIFKCTIRRLCF